MEHVIPSLQKQEQKTKKRFDDVTHAFQNLKMFKFLLVSDREWSGKETGRKLGDKYEEKEKFRERKLRQKKVASSDTLGPLAMKAKIKIPSTDPFSS
jgi:hypothetical protein